MRAEICTTAAARSWTTSYSYADSMALRLRGSLEQAGAAALSPLSRRYAPCCHVCAAVRLPCTASRCHASGSAPKRVARMQCLYLNAVRVCGRLK